jgi:hypothetical protein
VVEPTSLGISETGHVDLPNFAKRPGLKQRRLTHFLVAFAARRTLFFDPYTHVSFLVDLSSASGHSSDHGSNSGDVFGSPGIVCSSVNTFP